MRPYFGDSRWCRTWLGRGRHESAPLCCERATLQAAIAELEAGARRSNIPKAARLCRALARLFGRTLRHLDREGLAYFDRFPDAPECCWSGWPETPPPGRLRAETGPDAPEVEA